MEEVIPNKVAGRRSGGRGTYETYNTTTHTHTYSTYPILWKDVVVVVIVVTLYVSRFYYPLLMIRHQREVPPNFTLVTISAWFFLPHDGMALKERGIGRKRS